MNTTPRVLPAMKFKYFRQAITIVCIGMLAACNQAQPQKLGDAGDSSDAVPSGGSPSDTSPNPDPGSSAEVMPLPEGAGARVENLATPEQSTATDPASSTDPSSASSPEEVPGIQGNATSTAADSQLLQGASLGNESTFGSIGEITSEDPRELLAHIGDVDAAIQEVVRLGNRGLLSRQQYQTSGQRLGRIKMLTAQGVLDSPSVTPEQAKAAKIAKLVALSHLSGLQDVESAQKLTTFAKELAQDADLDVAHQGRVVLLGFEVQALANGLQDDPAILASSCEMLLDSPERRKFPEFVAVQNAAIVMNQLGHTETANRTADLLARAYIDNEDRNLRGEAWLLLTRVSDTAQQLMQNQADLLVGRSTPEDLAAAARRLLQEFPNGVAVEKLAAMLGELDAAAQLSASAQLVDTINAANVDIEIAEFQKANIDTLIAAHRQRFNLLSAPLDLPSVALLDGRPWDPDTLDGKVVLVDFWASWCINCIEEIKNIESLYAEHNSQGFEVVGICMDEQLSDGVQFVMNRKLPWQNLGPSTTSRKAFESDVAKTLGVDRIPFTLLVDRDGVVRKINSRGEQLRRDVEELLK